MNRRTAFLVLIALVALGGGAWFLLTRMTPETSTAPVTRTAPPVALPPPVLRGRTNPSNATPAARSAVPSGAAATDSARRGAADSSPSAVTGSATTAATMGELHFETDVPGVEVFLDRILAGVAPLTIPNVKPGPHRLNLSLPGYDPVSQNIEVEAGRRDFVFKFKEVRLNAKTAVVHKHRLGDCKGTLVATQRGLSYETTDKNDAFAVALLDVQALQMDYLENRLRIEIHGKRYDFTDPQGNADHLFVFHRDVEKALDRLRKGDPPAPE